MKNCCFVFFLLSIVLNSSAISFTLLNSGPVTIKLLATAQALDNAVTSDKTKDNASGTVETVVSKSTVSNTMLQSANILDLIENSLNTTLPSGSKLVMAMIGSTPSLFVTDGTGTNSVVNAGAVLSLGTILDEQPVHSGSQTVVSKTGGSGTTVSGNSTDTLTQTVVINYDDTSLTTGDGTHTKFTINCLFVGKMSSNLSTHEFKDAVKLQGTGYGTIHDRNVILQSSASANISGLPLVP